MVKGSIAFDLLGGSLEFSEIAQRHTPAWPIATVPGSILSLGQSHPPDRRHVSSRGPLPGLWSDVQTRSQPLPPPNRRCAVRRDPGAMDPQGPALFLRYLQLPEGHLR